MIADDMSWKEIKRKVGEMASMENDLRQVQGSRDWWKDKYELLARDVGERYVTLPKDANGATIRPGARVTHAGKVWAVRTLMITDDGEWLLDCQPEDGVPITGRTVRPELCIATYQRTVEDVLREFTDAILEWAGKSGSVAEVGTWSDVAAEYADEIRQILGVQS